MKRNHEQTTKTAVIAALAEKQPVPHIAQLYRVPVRTVYLWRKEALASGALTLASDSATEAAAPVVPRASVRERQPTDNDRELRAELRSAQHKISILRQALAIVAGGQV